jgi:hypothetical protein
MQFGISLSGRHYHLRCCIYLSNIGMTQSILDAQDVREVVSD